MKKILNLICNVVMTFSFIFFCLIVFGLMSYIAYEDIFSLAKIIYNINSIFWIVLGILIVLFLLSLFIQSKIPEDD
jgi:hypothetical protein